MLTDHPERSLHTLFIVLLSYGIFHAILSNFCANHFHNGHYGKDTGVVRLLRLRAFPLNLIESLLLESEAAGAYHFAEVLESTALSVLLLI